MDSKGSGSVTEGTVVRFSKGWSDMKIWVRGRPFEELVERVPKLYKSRLPKLYLSIAYCGDYEENRDFFKPPRQVWVNG